MGPMMVQQIQTTCSVCNGKGRKIKPGTECKGCRGNGIVNKSEQIELFIKRGTMNNEQYVFRNKANESPEHKEAGDLIFVINIFLLLFHLLIGGLHDFNMLLMDFTNFLILLHLHF